jgi:sigma-B regulation protein RsbU (phosphoserine phosphatase)
MSAAAEERLERMRAFGGLRRALRSTENIESIARTALRFAMDILACERVAVYVADEDSSDFLLRASSHDVVETIERMSTLGQALETSAFVRDDTFGGTALVLRGAEGQPIGILFVAPTSDQELLDELVFDVESILATRMMARLRAEELAVLEIQERELVGLLRDVETRDEIIQRDLDEARRFQRRMLGEPPKIAGAEIEVVYVPLGLVGGDLYAVSVDGTRVRMLVADATGHGVRASLTTMFIKSGYEAVRRSAANPAALLAALNEAIAHTYRSAEMLFSAACVDLDLATGAIEWSSAAHPPICLMKNGHVELLEGGGAFLGLRPGMKFQLESATIAPGDAIYLHTDGFIEARKGQEQFGEERFKAAVLGAPNGKAGAALLAAVTEFMTGAALDDDGTFVGLRFLEQQTGKT